MPIHVSLVIANQANLKDKEWTETQRKGYFVICFLTFFLERTLESKLKRAHLPASLQQIREALNSMNFAEVKIKQKKFLLKLSLMVWVIRF